MRSHGNETPLTMEIAGDGSYVIHAITPNGVVPLGRHASVTDAWEAIDAIDAPASLAKAA